MQCLRREIIMALAREMEALKAELRSERREWSDSVPLCLRGILLALHIPVYPSSDGFQEHPSW